MTIASASTGVGLDHRRHLHRPATTRRGGHCTVIVNSNTVGTLTVNASGTVVVGGVSIPVATDGYGAHDVSNQKTYVDARITIGTSATNPVGKAHTFTVLVEKNDGTGWTPASGATITSTATGVGSITGGTCGPTGTTGAAGTCTVIINSSVPGTTTVNASGTVSVNGVAIPVATNGYGAHDVSNVKLWADAAVRTDIHNASHAVVTTVASGDVVHDKVFVTKLTGTPASVPAPTGNVTFHRYATIDCTGAAVDQTVALAADGTAETSAFTTTTNMSYKADYAGDANYPARSGACEPLTVTVTPPPPPPPRAVEPGDLDHEEPDEQSVASGATVAWTIVVTNTGNVTLTNVRVTDPEAADCAKTSANIAGLASMAPGASVDLHLHAGERDGQLHERRHRHRHSAHRRGRHRDGLCARHGGAAAPPPPPPVKPASRTILIDRRARTRRPSPTAARRRS